MSTLSAIRYTPTVCLITRVSIFHATEKPSNSLIIPVTILSACSHVHLLPWAQIIDNNYIPDE